jgi:catechol 2,3-dioxygenase-like lactoylglutathione lyase family enzyme
MSLQMTGDIKGAAMNQPHPIAVQNFSHICIGVSDIEASVAFYTAVLGMDVVFDVELEGAGLDSVTGGAAQQGRMVGGLIGAAMVELLSLGAVPDSPSGPHLGYTNMSFRVDDLDATYDNVRRHHPDVRADPVVDIGGVRMFFIHDPDGTPVELLELPAGASTTLQLWRPDA